MGGRFIESPNAWDPSESSVAQETYEDDEPGVYFDYVEPGVDKLPATSASCAALKRVYGDSWWVDLERVDDEIARADQARPRAGRALVPQPERDGRGQAFDIEVWKKRASSEISVPDGELITIGVDGARFDDALAIVAAGVELPHLWPLAHLEAPEPTPYDYQHDDERRRRDDRPFERFEVWRVYIDPHKIEHLVERWQGRWGDKRVIEWRTNRPWPIGWAVRNFTEALGAGDFTHDGDADLERTPQRLQAEAERSRTTRASGCTRSRRTATTRRTRWTARWRRSWPGRPRRRDRRRREEDARSGRTTTGA
jgi:hypothetical protein